MNKIAHSRRWLLLFLVVAVALLAAQCGTAPTQEPPAAEEKAAPEAEATEAEAKPVEPASEAAEEEAQTSCPGIGDIQSQG